MGITHTQKIDKETFRMIFIEYWERFKEKYISYGTEYYEEVIQKMLRCGKEMGGYTEYICFNCGKDSRRICFSCKSSFCLSCAKKYVDEFVEQVSQILITGVIYRHIVLTVPEQLRGYFYQTRHTGDFLSAFMRCGYECLEDMVKTVKRQELKIGVIIVVQTHGRSGKYNPHLHIIMTNGGINEAKEKWVDLNYFRYEIIHKKWQYYLLKLIKKNNPTPEMRKLVDELWMSYPDGFVANVTKGKVPESFRGLAKYLAKYVASPPIAIKRILKYDGGEVTYWYNDHKTKAKKVETVDVYTFIGRMVQHIMPKGFQRVRYFGLQATKTLSKWREVIKKGLKCIGRVIQGAYQVLSSKKYRERYKEVSGRDPMICRYCGEEMDIWKIWHPKYGVIYDALDDMEELYEKESLANKGNGRAILPSYERVQIPLFSM